MAMLYRTDPRTGNELSQLGFGCMRFTKDEALTERMLLYAIEHGVNYFDTAYIYPKSEARLGRILADNGVRDKVNIATKVQPFMLSKPSDLDKVFDAQLQRLQTDHIDYYLIHMLTQAATWERLRGLGIEQWIARKVEEGAIGSIGFSFHGPTAKFIEVCDAYDWGFCLIQYNYMDEHTQAGRAGLRHAAAKDMAVMVMEPLRGGSLVKDLPAAARETFADAQQGWSPAGWSLRWLWDQPEVTVVLSGMNDMAMVEENIATADEATVGAFGDGEQTVIEQAREALVAATRIPCTGCGYCMPCPQGVDIPTCLGIYNSIGTDGYFKALGQYVMRTSSRKDAGTASRCIECGRCMSKCPQNIDIVDGLAQTRRSFEKFYFKPVQRLVQRNMKVV